MIRATLVGLLISIAVTGLSRFAIKEELNTPTPYRQCRVTYAPFEAGAGGVKGTEALQKALAAHAKRSIRNTRMQPIGIGQR